MYKKIFIMALFLVLLIILASCKSEETEPEPTEEPIEETEPEPMESIQTEEPIEETEPEQPYYMQLFIPIIHMLAELEQSGFAEFDEDYLRSNMAKVQLDWHREVGIDISDTLIDLQQFIINNFDELPIIVYAVLDSQDWRAPDLFIGLKSNEDIRLVDIIMIESFYEDGHGVRGGMFLRHNNLIGEELTITEGEWGLTITQTQVHSNGNIEEYFWFPNIGCVWLDHILTVSPQERYRLSYTGLEDDKLITEEEYLDIILGFGTAGVYTDTKANYIYINWQPVTSI